MSRRRRLWAALALPPVSVLYRLRQVGAEVVSVATAAVVFPYLDEFARSEIFSDEGLSPHERTYARAFKRATAEGDRSRGAHVRALAAVFEAGQRVRDQRWRVLGRQRRVRDAGQLLSGVRHQGAQAGRSAPGRRCLMTGLLHVFHEIGQTLGLVLASGGLFVAAGTALEGKRKRHVALFSAAVGILGVIIAAASFAYADLCNVEIGSAP